MVFQLFCVGDLAISPQLLLIVVAMRVMPLDINFRSFVVRLPHSERLVSYPDPIPSFFV